MRNFGGLPVLVALGLLLSACSSEPNLIAGDATDATQPSVQSSSAVAHDSAPFEVIPDTGAFLETTDEFGADDYPLLRYMEPGSFDSRHPGRARFLLVDDGEPARDGSDQFPLFVIGISAYIAESAPVDYSFSYNNHNQNEFGEIGYGRCRGVSGRFAQQSPTTYRFEEGRNPQVEDLDFVETSQGCSEMPPLTPANIFDGTVELEYGDTDITVISEDGERWVFQQIPIRSARQRAIDASPTTVAEATTTTTTGVERIDSDESDLAFENGVVTEVDCPGIGLCASAFDLNGIRYNLSCGAISNDAVGEEVLGTGVYSGQEVSVHAIGDYPVVDVVAISLTGGLCGDVDPEEFTSPWSFAFNQTDADVLDAVCEHGVMSPAQSRANGCES